MFRRYIVALGLLLLIPLTTAVGSGRREEDGPRSPEPGWNMHTAAEIGIDDFQANRAPDRRYRTAPLRGLWRHTKGGFYHDGRFATLREVVDHYNAAFRLGLSGSKVADLVEYLRSL
jgi:cytochrome c peroxidase